MAVPPPPYLALRGGRLDLSSLVSRAGGADAEQLRHLLSSYSLDEPFPHQALAALTTLDDAQRAALQVRLKA